MAGKHGSNEVAITWNSKTMTSYGTQISGFDHEALMEDTTPFGVTDATAAYAGVNKVGPITITGFYDDTATTGPDAVFNSLGTFATLVIQYANTPKSSSVSAGVQKYTRSPAVGKLTKFSVVLMPSGPVTET